MGQRTQLLIVKENNKGERKASMFHFQWGYGRVLYLAIIDLFLQDYFKQTFRDGYDFLAPAKISTNHGAFDLRRDFEGEESLLQMATSCDLKDVKELFGLCDNDDGGAVVHIKEAEKPYEMSEFKVAFLPNRGEDAFGEWMTPIEYGAKNAGCEYSDNGFMRIFESFRKYFEIGLLGGLEETRGKGVAE